MNLREVEELPGEWLTPAQVAPYLETDPNTLRAQARENPAFLGFPVTVMNSRVKINKNLFVLYFKGGGLFPPEALREYLRQHCGA